MSAIRLAVTTGELTVDQIVRVTGAPVANVAESWPEILGELNTLGIGDMPTQIAAAATVRVEAPKFLPIHELGGPGYFTRLYENRADLGNTEPGDGSRFHGRGFIQITGRANYLSYGTALGIDLIADPDLALDPDIAAKILARYFRTRKIPQQARAGNWTTIRRLVNGGTNGLEDFLGVVNAFERLVVKPS